MRIVLCLCLCLCLCSVLCLPLTDCQAKLRKMFATAADSKSAVTGRLEVSQERLLELLLVVFPHLSAMKNQLEDLTK